MRADQTVTSLLGSFLFFAALCSALAFGRLTNPAFTEQNIVTMGTICLFGGIGAICTALWTELYDDRLGRLGVQIIVGWIGLVGGGIVATSGPSLFSASDFPIVVTGSAFFSGILGILLLVNGGGLRQSSA